MNYYKLLYSIFQRLHELTYISVCMYADDVWTKTMSSVTRPDLRQRQDNRHSLPRVSPVQ